jgi:hypothetical protein
MKLQDLAATQPTKQTAKVFESYFGDRIQIDAITKDQARGMLQRVRSLVREHRRTPQFHNSEKNPAYLKLVMLEQVLSAKMSEDTPMAAPGAVPGAQQAGMQAAQVQQKKRQIQDAIRQKQQEIQMLQKQMNDPTMMAMAESKLARRLREASELQQAQVVLASQDMVDQVQKMSEQVSSMQFKDLPALVDQIKNEVGVDQATQFNGDASAALSGLLQNLGGAKQQLEQALGVVTGQAPQIPGEELGGDIGADLGDAEADLDAAGAAELDAEVDLDIEDDEEDNSLAASLGRGRR